MSSHLREQLPMTSTRGAFRDGDPKVVIRTMRQLESLLQQRLHFLAKWATIVWSSFVVLNTVTFWRAVIANPLGMFTRPPLIGFGRCCATTQRRAAFRTQGP